MSWKLPEAEPNDCIADIGCGYGGQLRNFRETLGPDARILGRDISQKAIDRANRSEPPKGLKSGLSRALRAS